VTQPDREGSVLPGFLGFILMNLDQSPGIRAAAAATTG
jgi:hypothetical protein